MTDPHSDYMLGNDMRVAILQDAKRYGVQWAAKMHRVSENSIYKWRKVPALAAQVTGDVMTDSDLISGLREWKPWRHEDFYMVKAADRIEALTEQLAAARQDAEEAEAYSEELEKERDDYAHNLMQANNTYTEMHLEIERLSDKLATCEKYRDAYDEMGRIGTQAVRDLEDKLAKAVEALRNLHGAVCGETGFAAAVRAVSGKAYPWPRLDQADADAHAALAEIKGESHE